MKSSVVERGFIENSPSRNLNTVPMSEGFSWVKLGYEDTKKSIKISLIWGLAITLAVYGIDLLLSSSARVGLGYTSAFIILAIFFAGGICANSRQMETQEMPDASAVFRSLWEAKFNLALMGIFLSIIFTAWMTLSTTLAAVSIGSEITQSGSVMGMLMAAGPISTLAIWLLTAMAILTALALVFVSLPMVIDGDQDFLNAMLTSLAAFYRNPGASILTTVMLAGLVIISSMIWLPLIALTAPIAIYALWHSYRSLVV